MKYAGWFFLFFLIHLKCASQTAPRIKGYDFSHPDLRLVLPDTLHEVSGIIYIDSSTVACIQDENGIIFFYDIAQNKIKQQTVFNFNGDYEGISLVNKTIYILRSDGILFEISDYTKPQKKVFSYETGIPSENNEGLCYDSLHNRLLIACKSKAGKGAAYKDKRMIYAFDLKTRRLQPKPVFTFDLNEIKKFAAENKISFPSGNRKKDENEPSIKFRPSDIGIHPVTKQLYVLSSVDHCLFVFNLGGIIQHLVKLDAAMFNKAEGITFYANGNMIVTNEGQDKKPTLLLFRYRDN